MNKTPALLSAACLLTLMATSALAQNAGVTAAVNQEAAGTPPGGVVRTIVIGDNIVQNERIDTSADGLVQLLLADGTAFTVGPNSSLSIDRFVYDPQAGTAQVAATLTTGVFRFIGGRTSKTAGGVVLNTRVGTAGIRGAVVDIVLEPQSGGTRAEFAMRFGQDVTLSGPNGATQRVFQAGYSIVVGANGSAQVVPTPPGSSNVIQNALAGQPGTSGGAPTQPTNPMVAQSGVPQANSQQPLVVLVPPVPTSRPEPISRQETIVVAEATRDTIQGEVERTPAAPQPQPPAPEQPPSPPEPEPPVVEPEPEPPVVEPEPEPPVVEPEPEPPVVEPEPEPPIVEPEPEPPIVEPEPEPPVVEPEPEPPVVDPEPEPPVVEPEPEPPIVEPEPEPPVVEPEPEPPVPDPDPEPPVPEPGEPGPALRVFRGPNDIFINSVTDVETTIADGRLRAPSGSDTLDLPLLLDPEDTADGAPLLVAPFGTGSGGVATLGGRALHGASYAGRDGFRAYLARPEDGAGGLVFAVGGTRTNAAEIFGREVVRSYAITSDPIFGGFLPFARDRGLSGETSSVSELFVIGSPDVSSGFAKALQASLVIDGTGLGQRSQAVLNVGSIVGTGGGLGLSLLRRGSENVGGFASYLGNLAPLDGPGGGDAFFGANGDYLVLSGAGGSGLRERGAGGDIAPYSRTQVGSLSNVSEIQSRSEALLQGFSSGLATFADDSGTTFNRIRSRDVSDTTLSFEPSSNGLASNFSLAGQVEWEPLSSLSLAMGGEVGPSAFVSNEVYAASSANPSLGVIANDQTFQSNGDEGSYLISGRSVPIPEFDPFGQGRCGDCGFIEWGWWGTQGQGTLGGATTTVDVHLGNWVAGNVTDGLDIDALNGFSADYAGGAVGTVYSAGQTYVATGDIEMSVSFSSRSGSLSISNFDGRNWGTGFETTGAQFQGQGGGGFGGPPTFGSANGAFVDGPDFQPAGGVIGNFGIEESGGGWRAIGVFGGDLTGLVPEA